MINSTNSVSNFPVQKKPHSKKTIEWRKACIDGAEAIMFGNENTLRTSFRNKQINYDLYNDILDQADIEKICNPFQLEGSEAPAKVQNYPIANPRIDVLVGESMARKLPWSVKVINEDAISSKEEDLLLEFTKLMQKHLQDNVSEEEVNKDLDKFQHYKTYNYQDIRERTATHLVNWLMFKENVKYKWSHGFKDVLIAGEEIYQWDIVAGDPVFKKLNPLNVFTALSGQSRYFDDSDIIVLVEYYSPGQIIDYYYEDLTEDQIDIIESSMSEKPLHKMKDFDFGTKFTNAIDPRILEATSQGRYDTSNKLFAPIDAYGNIRVLKVYWKSRRKMLKVTSYDENGEEVCELYDESYKLGDGETSEVLWINEWWEGHKLGGSLDVIGEEDNEAIYLRMRPKPVQFRSMVNKSICHPGIVGTIYNTNDNVAVSFMDKLKPYIYLFNVIHYNLELAISTHIGSVLNMDMALIPEDWTEDKWLLYVKNYKINVKDSFKEGNKGASQGKIAGSVTTTNVTSSEVSQYNTIKMYLEILQYINQQVGFISGVSDARLAQIGTRETVRNVDREITQSSHITEYLFNEHDYTKVRTLQTGLEVAKYCYQEGKNKKLQYVMDDGASVLFELDAELFNEADYGTFVTDSKDAYELINTMKNLAQTMIQNDKIQVSDLIDIYMNISASDIRNKIRKRELEVNEQKQQLEEKTLQVQRDAAQTMERVENNKMNLEYDKLQSVSDNLDKQLANAVTLKLLENTMTVEEDNTIDLEKLKLDAMKLSHEIERSDKELVLKEKDLKEKERHNKKMEVKPTTKK